ncbi:hypothetical protein P9112_005113 [Eukaryota sp. TZLM1-RC]
MRKVNGILFGGFLGEFWGKTEIGNVWGNCIQHKNQPQIINCKMLTLKCFKLIFLKGLEPHSARSTNLTSYLLSFHTVMSSSYHDLSCSDINASDIQLGENAPIPPFLFLLLSNVKPSD